MASSDAPVPQHEWVRKRMSEQKRAGTTPELALRRALFARGWRYRVGHKVPGMPRRTIDIAFPGRRVAVFVDGCFWHGCPEHCIPPKNNAEWWATKLEGNRARDRHTDEVLASAGWTVVRVWEHENVLLALARIERCLLDSKPEG